MTKKKLEEKDFYLTLVSMSSKIMDELKRISVRLIDEANKGNILYLTIENQIFDEGDQKKAFIYLLVIMKDKIKDKISDVVRKLKLKEQKVEEVGNGFVLVYFLSPAIVIYDKKKKEIVINEEFKD